jgi:non-heme chloroperoxidase
MPFIKSSQNSATPVEIYYEDWGTGKPVVFIHGWPLDHQMWEYQLTYLAQQGIRCIAYDRRGFGKSDKPWDGYDYNTMAGDLKALLDELDLNDVTLVGFSMGGGEIARYFGLFGGARVSKVVLVSAVVPYMLKTADNPNGTPLEMFEEFIQKLKEDRPGFLDTFGKVFYGVNLINHPVSTEFLHWSWRITTEGSPKATIDCINAFSQTDFRRDAAAINVPTLIIHGDSDKTVPIDASAHQSVKLIPAAKLIEYSGAPHGLFYTEKERLNKDLLEFVSQ